jgi:hypothetical protein
MPPPLNIYVPFHAHGQPHPYRQLYDDYFSLSQDAFIRRAEEAIIEAVNAELQVLAVLASEARA